MLLPRAVNNGFREIHEAAAFGINGAASFSKAAYAGLHGFVGGQCRGVKFWISAAQTQSVDIVGQARIANRTKLD